MKKIIEKFGSWLNQATSYLHLDFKFSTEGLGKFFKNLMDLFKTKSPEGFKLATSFLGAASDSTEQSASNETPTQEDVDARFEPTSAPGALTNLGFNPAAAPAAGVNSQTPVAQPDQIFTAPSPVRNG